MMPRGRFNVFLSQLELELPPLLSGTSDTTATLLLSSVAVVRTVPCRVVPCYPLFPCCLLCMFPTFLIRRAIPATFTALVACVYMRLLTFTISIFFKFSDLLPLQFISYLQMILHLSLIIGTNLIFYVNIFFLRFKHVKIQFTSVL